MCIALEYTVSLYIENWVNILLKSSTHNNFFLFVVISTCAIHEREREREPWWDQNECGFSIWSFVNFRNQPKQPNAKPVDEMKKKKSKIQFSPFICFNFTVLAGSLWFLQKINCEDFDAFISDFIYHRCISRSIYSLFSLRAFFSSITIIIIFDGDEQRVKELLGLIIFFSVLISFFFRCFCICCVEEKWTGWYLSVWIERFCFTRLFHSTHFACFFSSFFQLPFVKLFFDIFMRFS